MKKIEEIREGDLVLAYDEKTGEQAYKPVVQLFRNTTEAWYHVRVNGEEIVCTGGHPFYVLNADNSRNILEFEGVKSKGTGKWICARDLKKSDKVLLSDGSCGIIETIEVETLSAPETTYNFEVADFHTYYVSDNKVLVHNKCPVTELQMSRQEAIKYAKEFLGDDFVKVKPGVYQSADGLRRMRFDLTHHPFRGKFYSGNHSPIHINLYVWKVPIKRGSSCFMAGTLVLTAAGLKKIEEIREGDLVLAYDEETGEQAYKPVTRLFRNTTEAWYHVRVNDEEIICTGGHPFYILNADNNRNILEFEGVKSKGTGKWICARDLKISDKVLLSDGTCAIIELIEVETLSAPETTYNFEVADFHTYYVSDNKVLVHNKCPGKRFTEDQQAVIELAKEAKRAGGIGSKEAYILVKWAKEYGLDSHFPDVHLHRPLSIWSKIKHINILNIHILVKGE